MYITKREKNVMLYFIAFFFLIKPDYFSYIGIFTTLYNIGFIVTLAIVVVIFIKRLIISKTTALCLAVVIFPFFVSLIEGVTITNSILIPLMQTIGLCLLLEMGVHNRFDECIQALAFLLEVYAYVNFISIIVFPDGLYEAEFYAGNYWLLGYKNVMIRFLLPAVCINAINSVYRKGVNTIRLYCLMFVIAASLLIADNKTGLIGLAFMIIMIILFSKQKLPRFVNITNALIVVGVLSFLLGLTSISSAFSPVLEALGETVSVMNRQAVWYRAVQLFFQRPILGYGLRSNDAYRQLLNVNNGWGYLSHPHNYILYSLLQGGLVGAVLIVSLFTRVGRAYMRNKENFGLRMLLVMYLSFFLMGITESLTGAVLLYPLAIFIDGFSSHEIIYDYSKTKRKIVFKPGRKPVK